MASLDRPPSIVVLGGLNMDVIALASRLPAPGETIVGERYYTTPGGKGGNQAVAAARLGARTRMVGRVGADAFGADLPDSLRSEGVEVEGVARDFENPSGVAVILLDSARQNHIVAVYGANASCDRTQVEAAEQAMKDADALLLQLEIPVDVSLAAAEHARSLGIRVVWDPAPATGLTGEAYAAADILTPNQVEAGILSGVSVSDPESAKEAAGRLLEHGARAVVVKLGEQGAYYVSSAEDGHVPAYEVDAVDSVAAGDAFGAALAVVLCEGGSLGEAVRFGCAAGALAVTRPAAQAAMPQRYEVETLMASPWRGAAPG